MSLNSGTRIENASKNTMVAFTNKIIILLLTFVSRKFFIDYIGVEYLGINGLFSNILTLLSMAELGVGTAMNVSLYKPIANNDHRKISALLGYFRKVYWMIAIATFVIGFAMVPFLPYIINMDKAIDHVEVYYMIMVMKNVVSYLFVYKSSIIRADQKNYLVNQIEIYVTIGKVFIQIITIILLKNYLVYILLDVAGVLAHNMIVSYIANKHYPFIKEKSELAKDEKKGIFSNIYSVFLYKISWTLLNGTDNILMSVIVGTVAVGLYSNYFAITSTIEGFYALLFTSLTASVGNLVATASEEARYNVFKVMQMVSFWLGGIIVVCLFVLIQDFIQIWLGTALQLDELTMIAIVLNLFFSTCMRPVWTFREGTGMYRQIRYIMFVTAMLNLVLSIALGYWLGVSGILFATSISKLCTYFWFEPNILFKNFFHRNPSEYYLGYLKNAIVIALSIGLCYFITELIPGINLMIWVLKAIICFVIVNIIYIARYYKTNEFVEIKNIAKKVLKRG